MDQPSIFKRLSSYKPSKDRTPEEDFFSEAFVGVLRRDDKLAKAIFEELTGWPLPPKTKLNIDTQVGYPVTWPDTDRMRIRVDIQFVAQTKGGAKTIVFVESKLGSSEGDGQLKAYRKVLEDLSADEFSSKMLRYITKHPDPKDEKRFGSDEVSFKQMNWSDVYDLLPEENEGSTWSTELGEFMKESGLVAKVGLDQLRAGVTFSGAKSGLSLLLGNAWNAFGKRDRFISGNHTSYNTDDYFSRSSPQLIGDIPLSIWYGFRLDMGRGGDFELPVDGSILPCPFIGLWADGKGAEYRENNGKILQELIKPAVHENDRRRGYWKIIENHPHAVAVYSGRLTANKEGDQDMSEAVRDFFEEGFVSLEGLSS